MCHHFVNLLHAASNVFSALHSILIHLKFEGSQFLEEEKSEIITFVAESGDDDESPTTDHEPSETKHANGDENAETLKRYENRVRGKKHSNYHSHDDDSDYVCLGYCFVKCDGAWICCDACGKWKCYGY